MTLKAKPSFSLKDQLFNPEKVAYLAQQISGAYPEFAEDAFCAAVVSKFPELELKARITHMSEQLKAFLPEDYLTALDILVRALPPQLDPTRTDDDFGDFIHAPMAEYVAMYGCSAEFLTDSLHALHEMTRRFSVEGPIRFFINDFPDETMAFLMTCTTDDNYHVRRLASEGTRAKLPWAQKLIIDYARPLPILDALYTDNTRYVTRSVANHLNDIAKLDPDLVISTLARWKQSGKQAEKEMDFIAKHGLRTLVKQGNHDALILLGFGEEPAIDIVDFEIHTPIVTIGEALQFSFKLEAKKAQSLMIDYVMEFAGNGGKPGGRKVFKLKQVAVKPGKAITIKKKHPMKLMTTRRLYEGVHTITLQVNGVGFDSAEFDLTNKEAFSY